MYKGYDRAGNYFDFLTASVDIMQTVMPAKLKGALNFPRENSREMAYLEWLRATLWAMACSSRQGQGERLPPIVPE